LSESPAKDLVNKWEVFDNLTGEKLAQLDGTNINFIYAWPYKSEFRVKLTVIEPDGDSCSIEYVYFDEDCFEPCAPTGGGGAPPYKTETDPEPPCNVRIIRTYFEEIDKKQLEQIITIKRVKIE